MAKAGLQRRPAAAQTPAAAAKEPAVVVDIKPSRSKRYVAASLASAPRVAVAAAR
jgi:hypothetical protein